MKSLLFIRNVLLAIVILFIMIIGVSRYYSEYISSGRLVEARKIDTSSWDEPYLNQPLKDKYKIIFITTHGAEWIEAKYVKKAAEKMGWEVKIIYYSTQGHENEILAFDPDFIITTIGNDNFHISPEITDHRSSIFGQFYWAINTNIRDSFTLPTLGFFYEDYFDQDLDPNSRLQNIINISDGLLITAKEIKILQEYYLKIGEPFYALRTVPTVNEKSYEFTSPDFITIAGSLKDSKTNAKNFKTTLNNLNKEGILKAYGNKIYYKSTPEAYQGAINDPDKLLDKLNKNGIVLVVHRKNHFNNGIPTNRIMEAAAANTLIISDKNPFVVEEFGDSVLYFDANVDSETMTSQILGHYKWANDNPDKARELANKAHAIFKQKFTSEKDLKRIARMHEKILTDRSVKPSMPQAAMQSSGPMAE